MTDPLLLEHQISSVVRRLASTVPAPAADVEAAVRAAFDEWGEARVRDFVPILVERQVRRRLLVSPAP